MQFQAILTSITLVAALMLPHAALAKSKPRAKPTGNEFITDMAEAFKKGDRTRLATLLPQVKGHILEPWGAYWELSARLADASPMEVQEFFTRYAGTYQEDRLRNEWLLQLGKRRDWASFMAEHPKFRMNDDPDVRC